MSVTGESYRARLAGDTLCNGVVTGLALPLGLRQRHREDEAYQTDHQAAPERRPEAADREAEIPPDGEPSGHHQHERVDHEGEEAERHHDERAGEHGENRLEHAVDDAENGSDEQ